MIGLAAKLSRAARNRLCPSFSLLKPSRLPPREAAAAPPNIYFHSNNTTSAANPVALEMINYAMSLARAQKTEDTYGRGLLVLDQCETTQSDDNSKGLVELARSTLLFERGSYEEAIERLERIQNLSLPSVAIKVAASEALVGLYLERYQEDAASVVADIALQLLETIRLEIGKESGFEVLEARVKALKGLVELICGNLESAQSFFEGAKADKCCIGNAALSYGESLHGMRKFPDAKEVYQRVIQGMSQVKDFGDPNYLGACNMTPEEVVVAATCSLGQLEAHMGNFNEAEEMLTATLKKTEDRFGAQHPKVGVILTCIALMYRQKAAMEHSSSLLIQEGLYRRAIELLKAPPLEIDGTSEQVHRKDIIALARGGYAETLLVQQSRKAEGEKLKNWAETAWKNRWMSLADALELSESSPKVPVVDARICRTV